MGGELSRGVMQRARRLFPGGVSSPVRSFRAVGGEPFVASSGHGPYIRDNDGNEYIDFVLSWGALALGHAYPAVTEAVTTAAQLGTSFGTPTESEVQLAEHIIAAMPHIEMLRFVSTGTEATMSALRLARAFTGRDLLLKFDGCYHGHGDSFLVRAGSGVATLGLPDSPGVPREVAALTLTVAFNDADAVNGVVAEHGSSLAAIIVEPVVGNSGLIKPDTGFLEQLRRAADHCGAVLIFDEVMTGFRVAPGGATALSGVRPDLTTLGKVIGGGLPVGAYGGRRELMDLMAPSGPVYQAGTLSGNPLAMAAGTATLAALSDDVHSRMEQAAFRLAGGLRETAARLGVPFSATSVGSMWGFFLREDLPRNLDEARGSDTAMHARFFHAALKRGVFLAPSAFEAGFVSAAHDAAVIDDALTRLAEAMDDARA